MIFDKEFKLAISHLPSTEKDKLLLRLLKKDLTLANRLYFELVDTDSIDERRNSVAEDIKQKVKRVTNRYHSPGVLMMHMRALSGEISEHVTIAKDKYGDASLNLLLLNEIIAQNLSNINEANPDKVYTLSIYIVAKIFKVLMVINSLHDDFRVEFKDALAELADMMGNSKYLMHTAIQNGLDMNWLVFDRIPENIKEIHKDIRAQGFLR